jgi:hypothetical protein
LGVLEHNIIDITTPKQKTPVLDTSVTPDYFFENLDLTLKRQEILNLKIKRNRSNKLKDEEKTAVTTSQTKKRLEKKINGKSKSSLSKNEKENEPSHKDLSYNKDLSYTKDLSSKDFDIMSRNYLEKEPFSDDESDTITKK